MSRDQLSQRPQKEDISLRKLAVGGVVLGLLTVGLELFAYDAILQTINPLSVLRGISFFAGFLTGSFSVASFSIVAQDGIKEIRSRITTRRSTS